MKKFKQLAALLLSVIMVMSLVVFAQAAPLTTDDNTVVTNTTAVEITKVPAEKNVTFATYQILFAKYDSTSNNLTYHLTEWAKAALVGSNQGQYTTEELAIQAIIDVKELGSSNIAPDGQDTTEQTALLNTLAAASKTAFTANFTQDSEKATANLPIGSYLVTASSDDMSFLNMMVSVDVSDTTGTASSDWVLTAKGAVLKGKELTVDKGIGENMENADTVQIGDTVSYVVKADVPHFPADAVQKTFKITDTPVNLAITLDTVKVYGVASDVETELAAETDYTVTLTDGVLTVDFTNSYLSTFYNSASASYPYDAVKITYDATVLSSADINEANNNTVTLEYSNDPYATTDSTDSIEDTTRVYVYALDLTKYGETNETALSNAVFQITREGSALQFIKRADGTYDVYDGNTTAGADEEVTSELITNASGKLYVTGLDAGVDYVLSEIKAPSGYALNTNTLTINITAVEDETTGLPTADIKEVAATESSDGTSWAYAISTEDASKLTVSLVDTKLPSLPATGGVGLVIFTVVGTLLMIGAVILFFKGRKQTEA